MKTIELIALLAAGPVAVEPDAVSRRYVAALGWGTLGATLLMAIVLGVRPDIAEASRLPMFWVKLALPAALAAGALHAARRLSTPGRRLGRVPGALAAPALAIWALAALVLARAAPEDRAALIFGSTWELCPAYIALLSLPVLAAALWAMKGLAPTRLALAGAASGLLAGAIAALVYALHCPEMEAPFLATWYLIGILLPTVSGALIGPFVLRW